jgi:hypothetical protein
LSPTIWGKLRPNWLMIVVAISWLLISVPPLLYYVYYKGYHID